MFSRSPLPLTAVIAALAIVTAAIGSQLPAQASSPGAAAATTASALAGPRTPHFERWATISRTSKGYYYDAGQQHTRLVVTEVRGGVRFADTRTDVLRSKPDSCDRKRAKVGTVVVCRVAKSVDARNPMQIKVFTRLGNDNVDTSALSAAFKLYMLCDAGREIIHAGAGNDWVNGARNRDQIWGGEGNDHIQTGLGDDSAWGGPGNDSLIGGPNRDRVHGGDGDDRVGGGPANDRLFAGAGSDFVLCYTGRDTVFAKRSDKIMADCENVNYL